MGRKIMTRTQHEEDDDEGNMSRKIIYFDPELTALKEPIGNVGGDGKENYDQKTGIRCLNISRDGTHLASGDRTGNIRIHNLHTMQEMCRIEAHDAEVLSLEYSQYYLASTSRDRLIHVFDATKEYEFLITVDDHSSSITAVKFSEVGGGKMVSCGADKTIIFRRIKPDSDGLSLPRANQIVAKTTLYDMALDVSGENIITACQDRNVRAYGVEDSKLVRVMKGSSSEDGSVVKVVLDQSGTYFATSCTDKSVSVYEFKTGELVGTLTGHSELVTGLVFSPDSQHLITVSGDSCVFVWKLPGRMVDAMKNHLSVANPDIEVRDEDENVLNVENEEFGSPPPELLGLEQVEGPSDADIYRFSVGKLPSWAKVNTVMDVSPLNPPVIRLDIQEKVPRGKWATKKPAMQFGEDDTGDVSTFHESARKALFDETDGLLDNRNDEFKVNAMDMDELRKSVRKQKYRDNLVHSEIYNHDDQDLEDEEVEVNEDDDDCGQLNNTQNEERQNEQTQEMFFKSSFASLSSPTNTKVGTLSNAWREGNTPIQLRKQFKTTISSTTIILNSSKNVKDENVVNSSSNTFKETPSELAANSPSPVNSSQAKRSFLQKACSLLEKASQDSTKELHANSRNMANDKDAPKAVVEGPKHKRSSSFMSKLGHPKSMLRGSKKEKGDSLKKRRHVPQDKTCNDVPNYMKQTLAKSKKEKVTIKGDVRLNQEQDVMDKIETSKDVAVREIEANSEESPRKSCVETTPIDVSREPLSYSLVQACSDKIQEVADQLVIVYKRVSLDDAMDDNERHELLSQLSEGAARASNSLSLLKGQDDRTQGEIATSAMHTINQYLAKQNNLHDNSKRHFQELVERLDEDAVTAVAEGK